MDWRIKLTGALVGVSAVAYCAFTGVSLSIGDQIQPPGGTVQMQVFLTEPKPISTGKGRMALATPSLITSIDAVTLFTPSNDAAAAAVISGVNATVVAIIPSQSLGSLLDYPLMTLTGRVRSDAAIGSVTSLNLDPASLLFLDSTGTPYPKEVKAGTLTIANNVSITSVSPGAATVPAGGTVTIHGMNFEPGTAIRFKETGLDTVTYVSPTQIDVTVTKAISMYGTELSATNPDGTQSIFYAYQPTTPAGQSARSLFNITYPVFENRYWTSAVYSLPVAAGTQYSGLAVQNVQAAPATVTVALVSSTGQVIGSKSFSLPPNKRVVRETVEFVPGVPPAGATWRVRSSAPVQSLGLVGDDSTSTVRPVVPASAQ